MKWLIGVFAVFAIVCGAQAQTTTDMVIGTGVDPSFSAFYVAKQGGIFSRHGLNVSVKTGPSGSAMVALVVQGQVAAGFGAEPAGIQAFNLDNNVVVVAEGALLVSWHGIVGRNVQSLDDLKGKRIGVAPGTGSEEFWLAVVEAKHLNIADYKIVHVDAPEMIAALQRGDIDAFSAWEPWVTRGTRAVAGAKVIQTSEGILKHRVFVYMNKGWIEAHRDASKEFVAALADASDLIAADPDKAADLVATFLKLDPALTKELMPKLKFDIRLDQASIDDLMRTERQLKELGKLAKPVDYKKFLYPDLLRAVRPDNVAYTLSDSKS